MKDLDISKIKSIYFIGIGGIGMSAIARMFLLEGKKISGSDLTQSMVTNEIEKFGVNIYYKQEAVNISADTDLVVYTPAIPDNNPELMRARELCIPTFSYPEMLGIISKEKYTIAVSGTHGKTTTTAMIAKVMIDAGLAPTVIVGSFLKDQKSNFVAGNSKYFVVEACEYKRSFLNLYPNILVITNIDEDHLDYYKDIEDIQSAFKELATRLGKEGHLVCSPSDKNLSSVVNCLDCILEDFSVFDPLSKITLAGEHNKKNARAVLAVAKILGIDEEKAVASLNSFGGTWRRFEYKGKTKGGAVVYDDYAHHPTEIKATLSQASEMFPNKNITVVFQPHLYSRTKDLLDDFAQSFKGANSVLLAPIYAAREPFDPSISSEILAQKISGLDAIKAKSYENFEQILTELSFLDENNVLIVMGAGDVGAIAERTVSI
ncbi:MAG: UDP-N-acetylmuramate--L-alanine ligase [Candidatus Paceibacterota bacterium]